MDTTWKDGVRDPKVILNPELLWRSDEVKIGPEGCLSIPGISTDISRSQDIRMRWTDFSGAVHEETLTGFAAICAQHEYDHLDGIVTLDRLSPEARAQAEAALA